MQRYAAWLDSSFIGNGWTVTRLTPTPFFGRLKPSAFGLGKYLGYIDKYLIFPWALRRVLGKLPEATVCVTDHSHGIYLKWLKKYKAVVHCHDLFAIRAAKGMITHQATGWSGRIYQNWIASGLRDASCVCCVSGQTAVEFRQIFPEFKGRIEVTPNGRNYPYAPVPQLELVSAIKGFQSQHHLPAKPFLLHVGGNQWYKNRPGLVRAFARLCQQTPDLAVELYLVGKIPPPALQAAIAESGVADRVHVIVGASNEELHLLYSSCEAFFFPSISEGFGWPVTEAQACGAIVITTDKDPMREVGGEAAFCVPSIPEDGYIPDLWYDQAAAVLKQVLLQNDSEKAEAHTSAIVQARNFDPDKCFQRILNVYESL
jgi:glycosyltransferase involved in cell wall biosynthesis